MSNTNQTNHSNPSVQFNCQMTKQVAKPEQKYMGSSKRVHKDGRTHTIKAPSAFCTFQRELTTGVKYEVKVPRQAVEECMDNEGDLTALIDSIGTIV